MAVSGLLRPRSANKEFIGIADSPVSGDQPMFFLIIYPFCLYAPRI